MKISDIVADLILQLLDEDGGITEIQRNELANKIGCVPSQINYVISSRFRPENGFRVESRRGGGGYIKIIRVANTLENTLMHVINSVGSEIDDQSARIMLDNLYRGKVISESTAHMIYAAICENTLRVVPVGVRNTARADIMKQMLLVLLQKNNK